MGSKVRIQNNITRGFLLWVTCKYPEGDARRRFELTAQLVLCSASGECLCGLLQSQKARKDACLRIGMHTHALS